MFLLYDLYKTNKLIKEKEKRLDLDQYAMQERTIKNYKKANKDELKKYNEFLINVKKELEDKVKSILIAITISTTLSFNFVKFIQGEKPSLACTSIFDSVAGHLAVYLADESREHGGQPQKVEY